MTSLIRILLVVWLAFTVEAFAQTQPRTKNVDQYTFTRPEKWKWESPPARSEGLAKLVVPGSETVIMFYTLEGSPKNLERRALGNFDSGAKLVSSTVPAGEHELYCLNLSGATTSKGGKTSRPDHHFVGIALPTADPDVVLWARILGPGSEVEASLTEFTEMVVRAFKQTVAPMVEEAAPESLPVPSLQSSFNPMTVMASRFQFTRPSGWIWTDSKTNKSNEVLIEVIFDVKGSSEQELAKVSISHFRPEAPGAKQGAVLKRWRGWFESVAKSDPPTKPVMMGQSKVSYIEITGKMKNARPGKSTDELNDTLFGIIVDDPNGNILIRLIGPLVAVQKAVPDLKQMVEEALKRE